MSPDLITQLPRVDSLFDQYTERFGKQQTPYRNHVYRLVNLVAAQKTLDDQEQEALEVAAFFHDAGIWLAGTFDYLQPSARLAEHYLEEQKLGHHRAMVRAMILNHHKISRYHDDPTNLAEVFRRADWIDVSLGLMRFGVPMTRVRLIKRAFPNVGFHRLLLKLSGQQLLSQPWRPLPMLRR
ncbi:MAG TPA: HD domain-containing protein [Alcanivorax sp.]|jgi:hypothetical protein|uniref:HD domain-containing protein n=1 Tax=Alcanivorax jadensis T9 TaxID=1177181 RepID=A0ABR4WCI1_9GAMM|nr:MULTISPECIES: HD domain-containing protein [Alcanivorax]MBG33909.1 HD domain-containing protein [Alcanivorax sp.]KGD61144.1 hypothetical protein T9A_02004 [Alcanivorax jadensis T9]MBP22250.1 HD domain-containing protein [Alcanivorax sp.]MDF1636808.1 HD domain-containing protein [Alcanivorax jadensis]HBC18159.1 HD domain-containing protein [Alcanivorax sp.]|tara:strand:+ start:468 stop:1013 length:546 start_codon:yes stop_codon:yes gene_type:complete